MHAHAPPFLITYLTSLLSTKASHFLPSLPLSHYFVLLPSLFSFSFLFFPPKNLPSFYKKIFNQMYNNKWNNNNKQHHEYDSKNNPTFSSTLLDKINKSLKNNNNNNPKIDLEDDLGFFRGAKKERISTLRRSSFVEKWMVDGGQTKIVAKVSQKQQEFDVHDTLFFGPTSTSSSSSEAEYNYSARPRRLQEQQPPRATCFKAPSIPKPVRTRPPAVVVESKFLEQLEEKNINAKRSSSKALKIYSNLKSLNLKQPVSPGVKLTSFINSLFAKNDTAKKDNKNNNNNNKINKNNKDSKVKPTSYSACTTPTSYSRSCLSNKNTDNDNNNHKKTTNKKFQDDHHGMMMMNKRTVRFCPTSVILDEESRPCGQKSVFEDHTYNNKKKVSSSKFEMKKVEEVAYDLLSGYSWDSRTSSKKTNNNKNDSEISKCRVNEGDYGGNYGVNYVNRGVNDCDYEDNDDDDDGLSCTSSDLFELDNLNLIGNDEELPVYQTTRFHPKLL